VRGNKTARPLCQNKPDAQPIKAGKEETMKLNKKQPHHKNIDGDVDLYVLWRSQSITAGVPKKYTPSQKRKVALQKHIDRRFERHQGQQQILAEFAEFCEAGSPVGREVRL